jgi:hypothetical protein
MMLRRIASLSLHARSGYLDAYQGESVKTMDGIRVRHGTVCDSCGRGSTSATDGIGSVGRSTTEGR